VYRPVSWQPLIETHGFAFFWQLISLESENCKQAGEHQVLQRPVSARLPLYACAALVLSTCRRPFCLFESIQDTHLPSALHGAIPRLYLPSHSRPEASLNALEVKIRAKVNTRFEQSCMQQARDHHIHTCTANDRSTANYHQSRAAGRVLTAAPSLLAVDRTTLPDPIAVEHTVVDTYLDSVSREAPRPCLSRRQTPR
jgi:hypothetical protein